MNNKTGLLLFAGALLALTAQASAGFAQDSNAAGYAARIQQLENQVQTLSRAVYRGEKGPAPVMSADTAGGASAGAIANLDIRIGQIEAQQRQMTGEIERLTHEVAQMKNQLERALTDNEARFQQLQGGAAASPAPSTSSSAAPASSSATPVLGTLGGGASGPDALYESAFADVRDAKYDVAEAKLREFLKAYPAHSLTPNVQYWLGETYYVRGDFQRAARVFAQGYQDAPKSAKAADSLLKLGLSLSKLGKKDDACLSLAQLKKQFASEQNTVVQRGEQEMKTLGCK